MDWAVWFAENVNVNAILNGLGLGALAFLFATDRILTKGQHERRVADLKTAHDRRVADIEKANDSRVSDLRDARDALSSALGHERDRADEATAATAAIAKENGALVQQLLAAVRGAGEARG